MPTVDVVTAPLEASAADLLAVGVFAPASGERTDPVEPTPAAIRLAAAAGFDLVEELATGGFDGSVGSSLRVPTRGALPATSLLVVGLGPQTSATTATLRQAAAAAALASERVETLSLALTDAIGSVDTEAAAQAVAEGVLLGAYRFARYRSEQPPVHLTTIGIQADHATAAAAHSGVAVARVTAAAQCLVRDLVNTPPQDKRPPALAERAVAEVAGLPITAKVLDVEALAAGGYGGILGVGQGSQAPPRLVELRYAPEGVARHVALVGKGITFDTGGLSLKPSEAMMTMKMDMAGAATALAVVKAAAELELPVAVTAVLALAENMPSGSATRVSDVLTARNGTTIEVTNTDAEGRLVLADALVHAAELEPDAIVDIATLTGAAIVALGDRIGVLMSSDDHLADALTRAGTAAGEPLWRLPVATEAYGERLEGAIADVRNTAGKEAGTIYAGLFLHHFVPDGLPWAHLDIAGTAWTDEARAEFSKGATGIPARTLLAWLQTP
ncbi:MAG: leucyl aminopeptidase [Nitriliruptoraceae bacterium]